MRTKRWAAAAAAARRDDDGTVPPPGGAECDTSSFIHVIYENCRISSTHKVGVRDRIAYSSSTIARYAIDDIIIGW